MIVFRRRLMFWLIKAYVKKWGKQIVFFFLLGLFFAFLIWQILLFFTPKMPIGQKETIGMVGTYALDNLPDLILNNLSYGLTSAANDGRPKPGIARSWKVQDNGKTYIFYLKKDISFTDGSKLTSKNVTYNFSDATLEKPDNYTLVFKLKDSYSPFLLTVSKPVMKSNFVGVGNYKIKNIKLNGNFVQSLSLVSAKRDSSTKTYQFYPNADALKMAFVLGEITRAIGLPDINFKNTSFSKFPNISIQKTVNQRLLTTLFYNTQDPVLSDKKLRNALSYALPQDFKAGEKAKTLFSKTSWAYTEQYEKLSDINHAKLILSSIEASSKSADLQLKTLPKYKNTAVEIAKSWKDLNIKTTIEVVNSIPSNFQIFLGDFQIPNDPDQYTLWHSSQRNNITNYKNLRIDKLLEDGRKTTDIDLRKKIYLDLQKYLLDDNPASFLYSPFEYELNRN